MSADQRHKLIRRDHVTDAAVPDSQAADELLTRGNTGAGGGADAAYRSGAMEATLRARQRKSHSHRRAKRPSRAYSRCPAGRWASR